MLRVDPAVSWAGKLKARIQSDSHQNRGKKRHLEREGQKRIPTDNSSAEMGQIYPIRGIPPQIFSSSSRVGICNYLSIKALLVLAKMLLKAMIRYYVSERLALFDMDRLL
jgi:hypothetical protein